VNLFIVQWSYDVNRRLVESKNYNFISIQY